MGTALDTVLTEIRGLRTDVREDQKEMWKAIDKGREERTALKLKDAEIKGEIEKLKLEKKMGDEAFIRHVQNEDKHFNPYFNETLRQKLWRKKPEIAAGGGLGTLLAGLILGLLSHFGVI